MQKDDKNSLKVPALRQGDKLIGRTKEVFYEEASKMPGMKQSQIFKEVNGLTMHKMHALDTNSSEVLALCEEVNKLKGQTSDVFFVDASKHQKLKYRYRPKK